MPKDRKISDGALGLIAVKLKALAEESRLSIVNELRSGEKTVRALTDATGLSQPNISKHLRSLREARLVTYRKSGQNSLYRISDPVVAKLCDLLCAALQRDLEKEARRRKR